MFGKLANDLTLTAQVDLEKKYKKIRTMVWPQYHYYLFYISNYRDSANYILKFQFDVCCNKHIIPKLIIQGRSWIIIRACAIKLAWLYTSGKTKQICVVRTADKLSIKTSNEKCMYLTYFFNCTVLSRNSRGFH